MHIADLDAVLFQIIGEALRHALGERGDEHSSFFARHALDLAQQIVYLSLYGAYLDLGI